MVTECFLQRHPRSPALEGCHAEMGMICSGTHGRETAETGAVSLGGSPEWACPVGRRGRRLGLGERWGQGPDPWRSSSYRVWS